MLKAASSLLAALPGIGSLKDLDQHVLGTVREALRADEAAIWVWSPERRRLLLRRFTRESAALFQLLGLVQIPEEHPLQPYLEDQESIPVSLDHSSTPWAAPILRVVRSQFGLLFAVSPSGGDHLVLTAGRNVSFAEDDHAVARMLAEQLALVFAAATQLHREMARTTVLKAINRVTQSVSSSLEQDRVFRVFADETRRVLTFERASLALLQDSGDRMKEWAIDGEPFSLGGRRGSLAVEGTGFGWVARNGIPLVREDVAKSQTFGEDAVLLRDGLRSSIYVPLIGHSKAFGTFNLFSVQPYAYSQADVAMLQPIADQLALAIENAAMYGERGSVLRELTALQNVTDAALLDLDLQSLVNTLTERVTRTMGAEVGACFLFDAAGRELTLRASFGPPPLPEPMSLGVGEGFAGRVAQVGTFLVVRDVAQDPLVLEPYLRRRGLRSLLGVSLPAKGRVLGTLCLAFDHVHRFGADELQLLEKLAARVGGVIEHVQLRDQIRESRDKLRVLYEVSKLTSGSFKLEDLLEDLLEAIAPVLPSDSGSLFTVDDETASLRQVAAYRYTRLGESLTLKASKGLVRWAVTHNRAVAVTNCGEDPRFDPAEGLRPACSALTVPLCAGAKVVAALVVTRSIEWPFSGEDVEVAQLVAGHVTQVIENAMLLETLSDARLLRELDRAKTEFIAAASHELRTPLTAIKSLAETLLRPDLRLAAPARQELLQEITTASDRLAHVMDQLLDVSKIEAGRLEIDTVEIQVDSLVQDLVSRARVLNPGRTIELRLDPCPPPVRADLALLEAVVQNLLSNALKYSPRDRPVTVAIHCSGGEELNIDGPAVEVQVRDRGSGIQSGDLPKLFRPFSRIPRSEGRVPGAGLGLYVSKAFVEAMGGKIGVTSEPGQGSIFWVALPAAVPLSAHRKMGHRQRQKVLPSTPDSCPERPLILVVDDEPSVLRTAQLHLSASGYEVLLAASGNDALRMARDRRPNLVLLDVLLPDMSGLEVARRLRGYARTRSIPFIYVSARTQLVDRLEGLHSGAAAYITKPFSFEALSAAVEATLKKSGSVAAPSSRHSGKHRVVK